MSIRVVYPIEAMKISHGSNLPVPTDITANRFKQMVLDDFWRVFPIVHPTINIRKHGSAKDVSLKDRNTEILSDDALRACINSPYEIIVVFTPHPEGPLIAHRDAVQSKPTATAAVSTAAVKV